MSTATDAVLNKRKVKKPRIVAVAVPKSNGKSLTKRVALAAECRLLAMNLKKQGRTYREIADQLTKVMHPRGDKKVSIRTAFEYVQAELISLRQQTELDTQSVRDMELERCDAMLAGLWPRILKGQPAAVFAAVRVMERRSKLLGLDAPTKQEWVGALMTITPEQASKMSDVEIADRVTQLMNRVAVNSVTSRKQLKDVNASADVE